LKLFENITESYSHFYLINTTIWLLINRQAKNVNHDITHFSLLLIIFENGIIKCLITIMLVGL